jgi:hypothetical protein
MMCRVVDLSFWQQIKTFSFWFWEIIAIFPFYGVQQFFFAFVFLAIDKSDEYQLTKFILEFKKLQFLSGVINGMWGYIDYYFCSLYTFNTLEEYSK